MGGKDACVCVCVWSHYGQKVSMHGAFVSVEVTGALTGAAYVGTASESASNAVDSVQTSHCCTPYWSMCFVTNKQTFHIYGHIVI